VQAFFISFSLQHIAATTPGDSGQRAARAGDWRRELDVINWTIEWVLPL